MLGAHTYVERGFEVNEPTAEVIDFGNSGVRLVLTAATAGVVAKDGDGVAPPEVPEGGGQHDEGV